MQEQEIKELFHRFFAGTITPDEKKLLSEWIEKADNQSLEPLMHQAWQTFTPPGTMPGTRADELLHTIMGKTTSEPTSDIGPQSTHIRPGIRIRDRYWLAAAVLLAIICSAVYWLDNSPKPVKQVGAVNKKALAPPAATNAVLTLANGKKIMLDSAQNGSLAVQGKTDLVKLDDGQIAYRGQDAAASLQWNTLTLPRGSRIMAIVLSDGTKVWLNAGSSISYPVAFTSNERRVTVTGETYFEVTKDHLHPFIVENGDNRVEVLGTHFNVHAYEDETNIQITLLEGSITVSNRKEKQTITPGQMAVIETGRHIGITKNADVDRIMAWRNGRFDFAGAEIGTVMRELARWYDLEVEYKEPVHEKFYLETSRNTNAADLLKILETTGGVHFSTAGKKIIVMR